MFVQVINWKENNDNNNNNKFRIYNFKIIKSLVMKIL